MTATLRSRIETLLADFDDWTTRTTPWTGPTSMSAEDGYNAAIEEVVAMLNEHRLDLIPPNAIVIDPDAPETVVALAGAMDDMLPRWFAKSPSLTNESAAAAILPAFIARLERET